MPVEDAVNRAVTALRNGGMIVIYDGDAREGEADLVIGARFAEPEIVEALRRDAGGLICVAIDGPEARRVDLPFYTDVLEASGFKAASMSCARTAYGDKPAFSLAVNHRDVYTGIPDDDRSLTITKIDEVLGDPGSDYESFRKEFYSPGHVFLLIGRGLEKRQGHTELALELARRSGLRAVTLCEMLGSGKALPKEKAREYAKKHGLVFVEGKEIIALSLAQRG